MSNFYTDNPNIKFQLDHPLMEKIINLRENNFTDKEHFEDAPIDFEDAVDSYDKILEIGLWRKRYYVKSEKIIYIIVQLVILSIADL